MNSQFIYSQEKREVKYISAVEDRSYDNYKAGIESNIKSFIKVDKEFAELTYVDQLELHDFFVHDIDFQSFIKSEIDSLEL